LLFTSLPEARERTHVMPNIISIASLNLLLAVTLGAFGAHGLKARATPEQMAWWHTAVQYHFWHALGLFGIGLYCCSTNRHCPAHVQPAGCSKQAS
jgi:uncharacterized membrane protein YgdD (TMEM256/DUF423 family)